jgi:hypothetical protein
MSILPCLVLHFLWAASYDEIPPQRYNLRMLYSHGYVATDAGKLTLVYYDDDHAPNAPYQNRHVEWKGFHILQWRGGSGWNNDWQYTSVDIPFYAIFLACASAP